MKIIKLTAENVKRLHAVEIVPTGDLVVVGGANDAGKSSVLDCIQMALGGADATPPAPVRKGQKAAKIRLDLGDLIVTRNYTEAGGRKLIVENKAGARFPSPQAMLDALYGRLSFDPLEFERMEQKAQAETLRKLVGLDLSVLDGRRAGLYDERTQANREVKTLEVHVESLTRYEDAPAEEVSIAGIAAELAGAERAQQAFNRAEAAIRDARASRTAADLRREGIINEMTSLEKRLEDLGVALQEANTDIERRDAGIGQAIAAAQGLASAVPNTVKIRGCLADAEQVNQQVRTNRQHAQAARMLEDARAVAKGLTDRIEAIDAERVATLARAAFPVEGLGIDDDGVTLGGLPFEQASTSDRIRVSVAIGLAANPTLRVLLVRDGSLLGAEKLALLAEMAKAAGVQIWLELLQDTPDGRTTVFISEGEVQK